MRSSAEMWWTGVIGASEYMNCITQSLEKKNSILMFVPQRIPWHSNFIEHIKNMNPNRNTMSFNLVDCSTVKSDNLGMLLLEKFGSNEQMENFKERKPILSYLIDNHILKNRTVWLYNVPERFENKWINFIFEYKRKVFNSSSILCMEIGSMNRLSVNSPYIDVISWESHIFNYDVLMFAMHRVRNINEPECIKMYVSQIASGISSLDIELCDALIENYYRLIRYPERTVQSVCNEIYTNDKAKIFQMTKREFTYILWSAQEQVLFPIIEKQRLDFIKKYYHVVSANFQKAKVKEVQSIDLDTPMDMELGTLIDICNKKFEGTNEIKSNTTDWAMLKTLRHARNKIAHRQPVDFELFYKIVNCSFI